MATSSAGLQFAPGSTGRVRRDRSPPGALLLAGRRGAVGSESGPRTGNRLVAVVESEELQSARAAVGNFENGLGRQLVLETQGATAACKA